MKLRNKKTGEIGNLVLNINPNRESYSVLSTENGNTICGNLVLADYNSLAELNEEWEDYEEPKWYWYINCFGKVLDTLYNGNEWDEQRKLIGNYFETREEAEKAVEKLKAFKRLKDRGFRFEGFSRYGADADFSFYKKRSGDFYEENFEALYDELDLLFGDGK